MFKDTIFLKNFQDFTRIFYIWIENINFGYKGLIVLKLKS
jgi:hypothetical protein